MTLEELEKSDYILLKSISGSRAYGLDGPNSDTDIRGVFILPKEKYFSLEYISQINDEKNDIVYYELNKFVELALKNNPNILELLNIPDDCILHKHPLFDEFLLSDFLSKKCKKSFANYAFTQIKKARGLEKKIVNPMEKKRKSVLDFCYFYQNKKAIPLLNFIDLKNIKQENCGLANISHLKDCFNLFHNTKIPYKGIVKGDLSNDISLSSIPKTEIPLGLMYFNKDGYSSYCKKHKEYWEWVERRNEERYKTTVFHGKNYDSKNMMHTFRLLKMAQEIALRGELNVKRSDRKYLLDIKQGKFEYEYLVEIAEEIFNNLDKLYEKSSLPDLPNKNEILNLVYSVRERFYEN